MFKNSYPDKFNQILIVRQLALQNLKYYAYDCGIETDFWETLGSLAIFRGSKSILQN
jgi:hypothetical protein